MNSSSFSQWFEDQKSPSGSTNTNGAGSENESLLPLFITGSAKELQDSVSGSFNVLKSSFEAQFPSKVCGMSYPERFRVSLFYIDSFVVIFHHIICIAFLKMLKVNCFLAHSLSCHFFPIVFLQLFYLHPMPSNFHPLLCRCSVPCCYFQLYSLS
jgi:hypothetical protein